MNCGLDTNPGTDLMKITFLLCAGKLLKMIKYNKMINLCMMVRTWYGGQDFGGGLMSINGINLMCGL